MSALIELRHASKLYGAFTALEPTTLSLSDTSPSMTAVAGESGSGKTTLARIMLGFIDPTEGQVLYRGKDVAKMSAAERRQFRREVQPVFQDPFDVFNPFYRIDHVLTKPVKKYGLAHSDAEARKLLRHHARRALDIETDFGMSVDVAPDLDQMRLFLRGQFGDEAVGVVDLARIAADQP